MIVEVDPKVAAWMAKIVEALDGLMTFDAGHGLYELEDIQITFEGEDAGLAIGKSEFGDHLAIRVGSDPADELDKSS